MTKQAHDFQLGQRVAFTAQEHDPFAGQRIEGEVVMMSPDAIAVYRDEPWRTADAVFTWMPASHAEAI